MESSEAMKAYWRERKREWRAKNPDKDKEYMREVRKRQKAQNEADQPTQKGASVERTE